MDPLAADRWGLMGRMEALFSTSVSHSAISFFSCIILAKWLETTTSGAPFLLLVVYGPWHLCYASTICYRRHLAIHVTCAWVLVAYSRHHDIHGFSLVLYPFDTPLPLVWENKKMHPMHPKLPLTRSASLMQGSHVQAVVPTSSGSPSTPSKESKRAKQIKKIEAALNSHPPWSWSLTGRAEASWKRKARVGAQVAETNGAWISVAQNASMCRASSGDLF
jgi:hypothetical protein